MQGLCDVGQSSALSEDKESAAEERADGRQVQASVVRLGVKEVMHGCWCVTWCAGQSSHLDEAIHTGEPQVSLGPCRTLEDWRCQGGQEAEVAQKPDTPAP